MATCSRDTRGASAFGWLPSVSPYAQLHCAQRRTWTRRSSSRCQSCRGSRTATAGCSGSTRGAGEHAAWPQPTRRRPAGSVSSIAWRVAEIVGRITRDTRIFGLLIDGNTQSRHLQETVGVYDLRIHATAAGCTQSCAPCHAACVAVKSGRRWRSAEGLVHAHRVMMRPSE